MLFFENKPVQKKFLIFAFIGLCTHATYSESFRVHGTKILELSTADSKKTVKCSVNDAVAIKIPSDSEYNEYLEGIELSIKIPQIVANWRDSVAWSFYSDITPVPQENKIDYNGQRLDIKTFPNRLSLNIKVPLKKENSIKKDAYSTLYEQVLTPKNGYLFLRMQLAMKGTDEDITSSMFEISARPILINKGKVLIQLKNQEQLDMSEFTCFIDENATDFSKPVLLTAGSHTLSMQSQKYRNEYRTFTVEQAKTTKLEIEVRDIKPVIWFGAPEGTIIYLDGNLVKDEEKQITVQSGDHVVKFILGDYEIVKTLTCVNGISYNIAVNLDAIITEIE